MKNSVEMIIRNAEETLQTARLGLFDLKAANRVRHFSGLRNMLVFAHAAIAVLRLLESSVGSKAFGNWWQQQVLGPDALMQYMAGLREAILVMAELPGFTSVSPKFKPTEIARLGRAPAGANGFFIGDAELGSGWIIVLADGHEERYYVDLPESISRNEVLFSELAAPKDVSLESKSLEVLCSEYLIGLEQLVAGARREFLGR